jgi:hypothetical protein
MKIKLENNFHSTECTVTTKDGWLSARQVKDTKKKLCPVKDCQCSNSLGTRGDIDINCTYFQDGSVFIKKIERYDF